MSANEDLHRTGGASAPSEPTQKQPSTSGTIPDWRATRWETSAGPATYTRGSASSGATAAVGPTATHAAPSVAAPTSRSGPTAAVAPTSSVPAPALIGGRLREFIWLSAGVVDAFLALDFLFRALGSVGGGFVNVVTEVGGVLASPFSGIVRGASPPTVGHTADWPVLVAIVVYTAAAWIAARMCLILLGHPQPVARY